MTIDVGMLQICKTLSPGAFTRATPFNPRTAFIDGQLKLMRPSFVHTWDMLLQIQYVAPINRLFEMGATTVVLAFDNYKYTPGAKQPTQRKRTTKIPKVDWNVRQELPSIIPEAYDRYIMNRQFKARVCQLVVATIGELVTLGNGRHLIIDYDDLPIEFTAGDVEPEPQSGYTLLGESDVKYPQYLQPSEKFIADSVDGDYLAIALMQIERATLQGLAPPEILVRRIEIKTVAQKRARTGAPIDGPTRRQYEIVYANKIVQDLVQYLRSTYGVTEKCRGHEMRLFCFLTSLVGCDFTAGMPRVGPATVWRLLGSIWGPLQNAYDPVLGEFDIKLVADTVVAPLLHSVHKKHASSVSGKDITRLLKVLSTAPGLSDKARQALPSVADIACLIRNSNWTILYWHDARTVPPSSQPKYGFAIKKNGDIERDSKAVL